MIGKRQRGPLVSVVVPAWNAERTLLETLHSVSDQTYEKLEILIVDDGSTDATARLAEEFCSGEPRARLIRQANAGVAAARNSAIAEAKGEWVAPVDADDLWHKTKIEKQVAAASAAAERPGFVYCWHRLIDEQGCVIGSGPRLVLNGHVFRQLAYLNVVENGSALLLSRKAIMDAGGYDSSLRARDAQGCEDVMLQLQVAKAHAVACVPEYLVGHRRHGSNMSSDFERMVRSWHLVYDRFRGDLPSRLLRWVDAKCALDIGERSAFDGNYPKALASLGEALLQDPVRSGSILGYRAVRSIARRVRRRRVMDSGSRFEDVHSALPISGDPYQLRSFNKLVDRLNERRLSRLALLDQRCA